MKVRFSKKDRELLWQNESAMELAQGLWTDKDWVNSVMRVLTFISFEFTFLQISLFF